MRTIQSFILRLLVDADQPKALHGVLRCVSDDTEQSFADETVLSTCCVVGESLRLAFEHSHLDRRIA